MPRIPALIAVALCASPLLAADLPSFAPNDRPLPAKDAAKAMTLPPGFTATLFAGEPDVVQPIAMTFDDRGRLWVVECVTYPKWVLDGNGRDRVVILEDTNGDGVHDTRTVFLDNGVNLSGIEYGFGGIWLCASPNLVFVPDRNGDDKPDGPPEVVLDGWNVKDTKHNIFNSLVWGPDGWLYGLNGIQAKAKIGKPGTPDKDRVAFDCGVWRYHPTRKVFEVVAWGTTNPFGLDWNDHGEMFMTNCVIDHLWHVVPGGHYQRMYGDDPNPHVYGYMKSCCDHLHWGGGAWTSSRSTGIGGKPEHSEAGGGHAHSGCLVYLGDNFPAEYRNSVFMCNIHGNRLNRDRLERTPSGYVAKHAPDFLMANDSWFRGICIKSGPDGGLYVSDWTDTGECHNYDKADITTGRVFKVVYGTPKPWSGDIAKLSDAELVKLQLHPNDWFVRKARRVLQERAATRNAKDADAVHAQLVEMLNTHPDVTRRLRALWTLYSVGTAREKELITALRSPELSLNVWGIRLAVDYLAADPPIVSDLVRIALKPELERIAATNQSRHVLAAFAGAIQRLPTDDCMMLALKLARRDLGNDDPNFTLMLWYAMQRGLSDQNIDKWFKAIYEPVSPILVRNAARYIVSSGGELGRAKRVETLLAYMVEAGRVPNDAAVLAGIQDALTGLREFPEPRSWRSLYGQFVRSDSAELRTRAEALAVLFGNPEAITALKARITDRSSPADERIRAIELLTTRRVEGLVPILHTALGDAAVRGAALKALAAFPDDTTPAVILKHYTSFTPKEKADAIQTLASRPKWANALFDAIEKGEIPRADVSLVAAKQILALNDKPTTERLEKVWGRIAPVSKDRAAQIKAWKAKLPSETLKQADLVNGRALFVKHCAACHKLFGEGGDVGPDLTGSQRATIDYVLENVLDPSAVVPREFQVTNFTLTDGRVVSGIILKETPDGLTVRTVNDTVTIAKGDIDGRTPTRQSIMPEGVLESLKPEEVRDLIAYLATPHQVPWPKK